MYRHLSDLRILKLACAVEDAFEAYESELVDAIPDPRLRASLAPLFEDGPAHRSLKEARARLEQLAKEETPRLSPEETLQVILECERSAHDLYLRYLDRLTDSALVEVLRGLAHEEEGHARIVQQAILSLGKPEPVGVTR